jgi:DNA invertase Pin-like site-specific DNA recombinase
LKVGYARTSTAQDEQATSIEGQVAQLEAAGCDKVISEQRSAFRSKRRPGWDELWALVSRGGITEVLVVDQSRLSRSGDDRSFLDLCAAKGTRVLTLLGGEIETQSDAGFLTTSMISVMNEMQSRVTAAKVRDGLRRRREAGYYACGKVPFGYAYNGEQLVPSAEHWEAAQMMWQQLVEMEMNVSGWIHRYGMPWTPRGVRQWINNPILRGVVREHHGAVEALISWQEWERAQELLRVRSVMRGKTAHSTHLFTGLVKCECCGKSLHNVTERVKHRLKCKSRHCPRFGQGIAVAVVRERVIKTLTQAADKMATVADLPEQEPAEAAVIRDRIQKAKDAQRAGVPLPDGIVESYEAELAALLNVNISPRYEQFKELFADSATLQLATDEELRPIVIEFIRSITWPGGLESLNITLR